jgi:LysR family nitrogen assimilation transcriptional regulator
MPAMFDLRRLRVFVVAVEHGSMSRAADVLGIAQPAVSQSISGMEAFLGVKLLERTSTGVARTAAGDALYWHACQMLRQADRAVDDVRGRRGQVGGPVVLGLPVSTAGILSLPVLRATLARYPGVRLQINAIPSQLVSELVRGGRVDLGVVFDDVVTDDMETEPLLDEDLVFMTAAAGAGSDEPGTIPLNEVARVPLMIPGSPNSIHRRLTAAFALIGETPRVIAEIDALTSIVEAVRTGLGSAVLPWSAIRHAGGTGLDVCRIVNPTITRRMFLCRSALAPMTPAGMGLREILLTETRRLIDLRLWKAVHPLC